MNISLCLWYLPASLKDSSHLNKVKPVCHCSFQCHSTVQTLLGTQHRRYGFIFYLCLGFLYIWVCVSLHERTASITFSKWNVSQMNADTSLCLWVQVLMYFFRFLCFRGCCMLCRELVPNSTENARYVMLREELLLYCMYTSCNVSLMRTTAVSFKSTIKVIHMTCALYSKSNKECMLHCMTLSFNDHFAPYSI